MLKTLIKLCLGAVLFVLANQAQAKCEASVLNPVLDISWECIFPITLAGVTVIGGEEDSSDIASPICSCTSSEGILSIGLMSSFWEPSRIIDTVTDAYCMMPLGASLKSSSDGKLDGSNTTDNQTGQRKTFFQVHYYDFPVWHMLDMFYDIPCLEDESFDVAMMTEIVPTWNNDPLSLIVNPEAILFANPIASVACAADAAKSLVGMPFNALFWCMGSWGNAYPLTGDITGGDFTEAAAGIAARSIYLNARLGLLWEPTDDGCGTTISPIWHKNKYKLQMAAPERDSACIPIGRDGFLWAPGKHLSTIDNFEWMMFKKNDCCARYE